jgi:hypothetical protein
VFKLEPVYPRNKGEFKRLIAFCNELIIICKDLKITPIAYGSLVYFIYTKNSNIRVNDIDLLVSENALKKIDKALSKRKIKYKYSTKWHTIQIFRDDLKIEVDSYQFWSINLSHPKYYKFSNCKLKIVSLKNLIAIYKWASINSKDNPKKYYKRYKALKNLKQNN